MESAVVASPGGRWERAFLLLVVPPSRTPAADGRGAAEATEHEAEGTNKPSSLVLLHHPPHLTIAGTTPSGWLRHGF